MADTLRALDWPVPDMLLDDVDALVEVLACPICLNETAVALFSSVGSCEVCGSVFRTCRGDA